MSDLHLEFNENSRLVRDYDFPANGDVETAKKEVGQVVEGINALPAACKLAKKYKVEMPIVNAVDDILSGRLAARDALATMMGRQLKQE